MRIAPTSKKMSCHAFQLLNLKKILVLRTKGQNDFDDGDGCMIRCKQFEEDLMGKVSISTQYWKIGLIVVSI
jgi:hypothetical protein